MNATGPATAVTPELPPQAVSQPSRIINTFIAPTKAFTGLDRSPQWWMAWLLLVVLSYGFVYTMMTKIGIDQIQQSEMARNPKAMEQLDKLPPDQRAQRLEMGAKITKAIMYAVPIIGLLMYVVVAAILMATFNFGMGAKVSFGTALAITVYAYLPSALGAIMGIVSMFGVNPDGFNIRNPIASNLGYFMDPNGNKFLYGLASGVDIFALWTVVLLGIGFACNTKVKRSTAIVAVLCWFLLYKLVGAAGAAVM